MRKYIDADEFVKEMNDRIDAAIKWGVNAIAERNEEIKTRAEQAVATFCEASLTAKKMPAADVVEVRHGRWLQPYHNKQYKKCSVCGSVFSVNLPKNANYCPNCGAKMEGIDEQSGIM